MSSILLKLVPTVTVGKTFDESEQRHNYSHYVFIFLVYCSRCPVRENIQLGPMKIPVLQINLKNSSQKPSMAYYFFKLLWADHVSKITVLKYTATQSGTKTFI